MSNPARRMLLTALCLTLLISTAAAAQAQLVVYSGRGESLVGPLFEAFEKETGISVQVRYGGTSELAATILEEGRNTRADVFFAQDAGALGAVAAAGGLLRLNDEVLERVPAHLRSPDGLWVGVSGRARVVSYNTRNVDPAELPDSIWGFTDPKWRGRIGWAPTNASLQAMVTALRLLEGDDRAAEWLRGIQANRPRVYPNNSAAVDAVGRGEVDAAFVNHYYLYRFLAEQGEGFPVRNHYTTQDAGAMVNIAGVGVLSASSRKDEALRFVEFLLSPKAQAYFAEEVHEYPLISDPSIELNPLLLPLDEIDAPELDLSDLRDLEATLELMLQVGVL